MTKKITVKEVYNQKVGDLYDETAISCSPISRDKILNLAAKYGVGKNSFVLDIGCANGGLSRKLLDRTGCQIKGVELLEFLVKMGREENKKAGIRNKFTIQQGTIAAIPFPNDHFDFVFCSDVIGIVGDVPTALDECRRVLKPKGKMLVYITSLPTDRLSQREARELFLTQGHESEKALTEPELDKYIKDKFTVLEKLIIGSQFTQYDVENSKDTSEATKNLLRIARLLTWPGKYIKKHGEQTYRIVLAGSHLNLYILLGKIQPAVYIVQKV